MGWKPRAELDKGWKYHDEVAVPELVADALAAEAARVSAAEEAKAEAAEAARVAAKKSKTEIVPWGIESPARTGARMRVFDRAEVERFAASLPPGDSDQSKRKNEIIKLMRRRGEFRKLATMPKDWRARLDEFAAQFPNVVEVTQYLRHAFALAEQADRVPRVVPMLLTGDPGVGKSYWARRFAEFLGSGFVILPVDSLQAGSSLSGSQEYWTNTKPGIVFEQLVERDFANPVVLLEELDKADVGYSYGDPRNALHQLFEPGTAREFRDLSVPAVALDASRVIWVATANEPARIPAPLLSRMRRFEVKAPTPEQGVALAVAIFVGLRLEHRLPEAFANLSAPVVARVCVLSPRRIRQVLEEAIGRALYAGRTELLAEDIQLPPEAAADTRRFGFV